MISQSDLLSDDDDQSSPQKKSSKSKMFTTFKKKSQIQYIKSDIQRGINPEKHKSMVNKLFQNKYVNQDTHLSQDPRPKSKTEAYLIDDVPFKPKFMVQSEAFNLNEIKSEIVESKNKMESDNYTSINQRNMVNSHLVDNEKILDESYNKWSPKQSGVFIRKKKVNKDQIKEKNDSKMFQVLDGK
jgi:hypothetical protein